jgi:PKD repeat protein
MSQSQSARKKVLPVALGSVLALAALLITLTGTARAAAQYGELTRFGTTGDAEDIGGIGQLDELRTRAIGVDPRDNSVYVVDEPEGPTQKEEVIKVKLDPQEVEECEEEENSATKQLFTKAECEALEEEETIKIGPITRHLRLQKLTQSAGTYTVSAAARFSDTSEEFESESESPSVLGIEGIAVDPAENRVYLLAADARNFGLPHDRGTVEDAVTKALMVASTVYAFSTKEQSGQLVGAGVEGPSKEVLAGPGVLKAQGPLRGEPLLAPSGITVDPATHEVIILGHKDDRPEKKKEKEPEEFDELQSQEEHYALQGVQPNGTLGSLYVDTGNVLKAGVIEEEIPNSPTFASESGVQHEYVLHEGLVEIPAAGAPKVLFKNPPFAEAGAQFGISHGGLEEVSDPTFGGALSASPPEGESAVATIYGRTNIKNEAVKAISKAGVIALSPAGAEIGWTGGQGTIEPATDKDNCTIEPDIFGANVQPIQVAAGSGGKVFALGSEFLLRSEPKQSGAPLGGPFFPAVIEFGPNPPAPPGSVGCLEAKGTTPIAVVKGKVVPEATFVSVGTEVSFRAEVKQADALKVEWDFGDGSKVTVVPSEPQSTTVKHTFTKASPPEGFPVKETIHTDNLATPEVVVERKIHIGEPPPPIAELEGPAAGKVNEALTFRDPSPGGITSYEFVFGDGTKETTKVPTAKHAFTKPGEYKVSLTVTNGEGKTSSPTSIAVKVTEEETGGTKGGGGGGTTGGGGGGTTGGGGGGTTGGGGTGGETTGKTGVASFKEGDPEAKLASTALTVSSSGAVVIDVTCPVGESTCSDTVTLRTLSAVVAGVASARAHATKSKASILTLATGSFTVTGGDERTVTLHLSSSARKLLARAKTLRAKATILAHDPSGASKTTLTVVTLRLAKAKHGKH